MQAAFDRFAIANSYHGLLQEASEPPPPSRPPHPVMRAACNLLTTSDGSVLKADACHWYVDLVKYSSSWFNVGDALQTIAMKEFLLRYNIHVDEYRDRKALRSNMVINGWHRNPHEKLPRHAFFVGLHTDAYHLQDVEKGEMIGCRDEYTLNQVQQVGGLRGILSYCVTTTFDVYTGPRKGTIHVNEVPWEELPVDPSWDEQVRSVYELLHKLKTAELVFTDRLHVILPCIAFGTPVILRPRPFQSERFSLFDNLPEYRGHGQVVMLESGLRERLRNQFIWAFEEIYKEFVPKYG